MHLQDVTHLEYVRAVRFRIQAGKQNEAFILVQHAVVRYPEDPYILSYYGYLQSVCSKKYRTGVENCRKALRAIEKDSFTSGKPVHPFAYVNLAKAYLAAGKRKDAFETLQSGLKYDQNNEILNEMKKIGMRRKPPVPFLDRSNPINKYLGIMLYSKEADRAEARSL